jgi:single-strand DNA-binding protein|nr:MAG TPA: Single strand binding protein [Caudoviricetes sp.]
MAINKVILLGNVGNAPKMYTFDDGRKAAQISLATSTPEYQKKDGTKVNAVTEWHNVVLYTPLAEIAEKYVHKGINSTLRGVYIIAITRRMALSISLPKL